ncbi:hypothetical protein M0R36_04235 [bacterium]|nr:hypothetical protein [bacterium]
MTKELCGEKHIALEKENKETKEQLKEHDEKIRVADVKFTELSGDIKHIKDRIDNGLSKTVYEIREKMDEFIPVVRDSAEWAGKFKQAVYFISVTCIAGGLIGLAFYVTGLLIERIIST